MRASYHASVSLLRQSCYGLARVIVTTTERLPSVLAHRAPPVEVIGRDDPTPWCLLELECSPGAPADRDAVTVVKRRGTRAPNVVETAKWFRAEHDAGAFVISNSSAGLDRAMNHMVARGRNDLTEMEELAREIWTAG